MENTYRYLIKNKKVYTFFCSQRELEIYIKELEADSKVMSPISLKNKLKDYYLKASNLYNQEDYNDQVYNWNIFL